MTKEYFCSFMEKLTKEYLEKEKWIDNVCNLLDMSCETFYKYDFMPLLMDLFIEVLDDKYGWLEYFIFEKKCQWFEYEENGQICKVDSYEKLYNLIIGD